MSGTSNEKALSNKRASHVADVEQLLDPKDAHLASRDVDAYCELTPPIDPPLLMHHITLKSGGLHGGESRKPGNLRFNWRKLTSEFADMVMNTVGVISVPHLIPFAALSIWNRFWTHATVQLSREQSTALFAMWHRKDADHKIDINKAFMETNELPQVFRLPLLNKSEFAVILSDLVTLDCVEIEDVAMRVGSDDLLLKKRARRTERCSRRHGHLAFPYV